MIEIKVHQYCGIQVLHDGLLLATFLDARAAEEFARIMRERLNILGERRL